MSQYLCSFYERGKTLILIQQFFWYPFGKVRMLSPFLSYPPPWQSSFTYCPGRRTVAWGDAEAASVYASITPLSNGAGVDFGLKFTVVSSDCTGLLLFIFCLNSLELVYCWELWDFLLFMKLRLAYIEFHSFFFFLPPPF